MAWPLSKKKAKKPPKVATKATAKPRQDAVKVTSDGKVWLSGNTPPPDREIKLYVTNDEEMWAENERREHVWSFVELHYCGQEDRVLLVKYHQRDLPVTQQTQITAPTNRIYYLVAERKSA